MKPVEILVHSDDLAGVVIDDSGGVLGVAGGVSSGAGRLGSCFRGG
jgi:hypothetical protein